MKKLIEDLKNPKKRSIALLIMYGIFFTVVFILIHIGENISYDEPVSKTSYNFKYLITSNEEVIKTGENEIYSYDIIKRIIDNSDSKTTFKDSNMIVYNITAKKYFDIFNEEIECEDCDNIYVSLTEYKNENEYSVNIDLSNYYNENYTVTINYKVQ